MSKREKWAGKMSQWVKPLAEPAWQAEFKPRDAYKKPDAAPVCLKSQHIHGEMEARGDRSPEVTLKPAAR